ncbi:septal ring lytic transglycosylase RlpA family protein [Thiomonas sp.]
MNAGQLARKANLEVSGLLEGRKHGPLIAATLLLGLALGGCASAPSRSVASGEPVNAQAGCHAPPPNLRAAYNRTYTVHGRSYTPLRSADGYDEVGIASWYGWESGTTTSMGMRFNPRGFTAASRVLPLPTCVQVTNLDNGLSALVLVNDRGPFVSGRLLDLSMGAAQALGVTRTGTARVRVVALPEGANAPLQFAQAAAPQTPQTLTMPAAVPQHIPLPDQPKFAPQQFATQPVAPVPESIEVQTLPPLRSPSAPGAIGPQTPASGTGASAQPSMPQPAPTLPVTSPQVAATGSAQADQAMAPAPSASPLNYVQTGAFILQANAESEKARLQAAGIADVLVVPGYIRGQTFYRVQIGPLAGVAPDATLVQQLLGLGLRNFSVVQQ